MIFIVLPTLGPSDGECVYTTEFGPQGDPFFSRTRHPSVMAPPRVAEEEEELRRLVVVVVDVVVVE